MNAAVRGLRNVVRDPIRAVLVGAVLALAVAVFLTLALAARAVERQTAEAGGQTQNLIEVRAAGASGMGTGVDALPESFFAPAEAVAGVEQIEPYLYQRTFDPSGEPKIAIFVGVEAGTTLRVASHGEVGSPRLVDGRGLESADRAQPVAVVGRAYAEQYGLEVGDTLEIPVERVLVTDRPDADAQLRPVPLTVVGIFESGFLFGDNQVFLPLAVAQEVFDQPGGATHVFVTAASAEAVDQVERGLRAAFGERADVIGGGEATRAFVATLADLRATTTSAATVALAVAAAIVVLTMVLVVRERTHEIGVLKALGAGRREIVGQYLTESVGVAAVGAALGVALTALFAERLASVLLPTVASSVSSPTLVGGENPFSTVGVDTALSPTLLAVTLLVAVALGLIGSLYPLAHATRLSPLEALRHDR